MEEPKEPGDARLSWSQVVSPGRWGGGGGSQGACDRGGLPPGGC